MKHQRAFTLIELLIVLGLITLLVAVLVPNLLTPSVQGQRTETLTRLQHLELCIRTYERKHGYYPPSSFSHADKDVKVKNNGINEGIECLLVHVHKQSLGGTATLEDKVDWLINTDGDDGGFDIKLLETTKLFEVADAWFNPIVYFREDSYGQKQTIGMWGEDQEQETVQALRNPSTNKFLSPRKWQLISAGQDRVFGTEDDISIPPKPKDK
jgi:prepilin-type N-terminal cleavage/methylation domain-containing protein